MRRTLATVALLLAACGDSATDAIGEFCELATDRSKLDAVFAGVAEDNVLDAGPSFRAAREAQRALRTIAPVELHDDIDVLTDYVDDVIAILEDTRPDEERAADLVALDVAPVRTASARLDRYVAENCP